MANNKSYVFHTYTISRIYANVCALCICISYWVLIYHVLINLVKLFYPAH